MNLRRPSCCIAATFSAIAVCSVTTLTWAADYYVDPDGSNSNPGSESAPFETIQKAAEEARPGDTVYVRQGFYRESVRPSRSGTSSSRITFKAHDGETVVISGADAVYASWRDEGDGVYSADVDLDYASAIHQSPQVFVDGVMYFEARWPNTEPANISEPNKATVDEFVRRDSVSSPNGKYRWQFKDSALSGQPDLDGAKVYLQPSATAWSWVKTGVVDSHSGTTLSVDTWGATGADNNQSRLDEGARYYVFGKASLLDAGGEWFHDGDRLYVKTLDGEAPESGEVEVKQRDFAFNLHARKYITIRGFEIFAATITTDVEAGSGSRTDGDWRQNVFDESSHVIIDGVLVYYPSHTDTLDGHMMGQWGQNTGIVLSGTDHVLRNSFIRYSSGNGVTAIGRRHEIANNLILDVNYNATEAGCIGDGMQAPGSDQEWHHNTCLRSGRSGLQVRQFQNSSESDLKARIHHNIIGNYGLQDFDVGAFYAPDDGNFARIDHNIFYLDEPQFFHAGIYFDVGAEDFIVDHNVVWGVWAGASMTDHQGMRNLLVYNNTLVAGSDGAPSSVKAGGSNEPACDDGCLYQNNLLKVAVWYAPNPVNQWPDYGGADVVKNMNFGRHPDGHRKEVSEHLHEEDVYEHNVGFQDAENGNYRLTASSPAIDEGISVAGLTRKGVSVGFEDATDGKPDLGAYERGREWTAGSDLDVDQYTARTPTRENGSPPPACEAPKQECGNQCVDLTSDADHCGACNFECTAEQVCTDSSCECQSGLSKCENQCVDLTSNHAHCGGCGNACSSNLTCVESSCVCADDLTNCSGTCVELQTDESNCGSCGETCGSNQTCADGECTCPGGLTLCGGECVNTSEDVQHCGGCEQTCSGGQVCSEGSCSDQCASGLTECGRSCVDLDSSLDHCGGCGTACDLTGAIAVCTDGQCAISDCQDGAHDLDGRPANGCEYACRAAGEEVCNGVDDDCDGEVDEGTGTEEVCNGVDDDCDGSIDEGLSCGGGGGNGDAGVGVGDDAGVPQPDSSGAGCACRLADTSASRGGAGWALVAMAAAAGLSRRRRRPMSAG